MSAELSDWQWCEWIACAQVVRMVDAMDAWCKVRVTRGQWVRRNCGNGMGNKLEYANREVINWRFCSWSCDCFKPSVLSDWIRYLKNDSCFDMNVGPLICKRCGALEDTMQCKLCRARSRKGPRKRFLALSTFKDISPPATKNHCVSNG